MPAAGAVRIVTGLESYVTEDGSISQRIVTDAQTSLDCWPSSCSISHSHMFDLDWAALVPPDFEWGPLFALNRCAEPGCRKWLGNMGSTCTGCRAVKYCGKNCQELHWRRDHKASCQKVRRTAKQLEAEKKLLQNSEGGIDYFSDPRAQGRFFTLPETRRYLASLDAHADAFAVFQTTHGWAQVLRLNFEHLRLHRSDKKNFRKDMACIMLFLGLEQLAYDFMRFWATVGDRDWQDMTLPYLDVRDADPLENPENLFRDKYAGLSEKEVEERSGPSQALPGLDIPLVHRVCLALIRFQFLWRRANGGGPPASADSAALAEQVRADPGLRFLVKQAHTHNRHVWKMLADREHYRDDGCWHTYYARGSVAEAKRVARLVGILPQSYPQFFRSIELTFGPSQDELDARWRNPFLAIPEKDKEKLGEHESLNHFLRESMAGRDCFSISGLESDGNRALNGGRVRVVAVEATPSFHLVCEINCPGGGVRRRSIKAENLEMRPNATRSELGRYMAASLRICNIPSLATSGTNLNSFFAWIVEGLDSPAQKLGSVLSTPRYCPCGSARLLACDRCYSYSEHYARSQEYGADPPETLLGLVLKQEKPVADFIDYTWTDEAERRCGFPSVRDMMNKIDEQTKHMPSGPEKERRTKELMDPVMRIIEENGRRWKEREQAALDVEQEWRRKCVAPLVEAEELFLSERERQPTGSHFYLIRAENRKKPLLSLFDPCGLKTVLDLAEKFVKHRAFSGEWLREEILPQCTKAVPSESLGAEAVRFAANITIEEVLQMYDLSGLTLHGYYAGDSRDADHTEPPQRPFARGEWPLGIVFNAALYGYSFWLALSYALAAAENGRRCGKWRVGDMLLWTPSWRAARVQRSQQKLQVGDSHDFFRAQVRSEAARQAAMDEVAQQHGMRQRRKEAEECAAQSEFVRRAWNRYVAAKEMWAKVVASAESENTACSSSVPAEDLRERIAVVSEISGICAELVGDGDNAMESLGPSYGPSPEGGAIKDIFAHRDPLLFDLATELRVQSAKQLADWGGVSEAQPTSVSGAESLTLREVAGVVGANGNTKPSKGVICQDCGELIPKPSFKRHKEKKCRRRLVRCPNAGCSAHKRLVPAEELSDHLARLCTGRQVACSDCHQLIRAAEADKHERDLCPCRSVGCDSAHAGCTWRGQFLEKSEHEITCPYAPTQCDWCFELMPQHQMPSHECRVVPAGESCGSCLDSFAELFCTHEVLPAVLVCDGLKSCRCPRPTMCVVCALTWRQKSKDEAPKCAFCQTPYDGVAAFAAHLLELPRPKVFPAVDEGQRERKPIKKPHQLRQISELPDRRRAVIGSTHWVSPLQLRFTHDSVSGMFRDFDKLGVRVQNQTILNSLQEVLETCSGGKLPKSLDCLDVCWDPRDGAAVDKESAGRISASGKLFLAGTGNRRLTMWRLLAIFFPEKFRRIKVRLVNGAHPRVKFVQKCTTLCEGRWIQVRKPLGSLGLHPQIFVGLSAHGAADWDAEAEDCNTKDPGVQWDEAVGLIGKFVQVGQLGAV